MHLHASALFSSHSFTHGGAQGQSAWGFGQRGLVVGVSALSESFQITLNQMMQLMQ